jgi:hypothetical protein
MDAKDVPVNVKIVLNLIERELAPTFLVLTFMISVGAYYFFSLLLSIGIVALFFWLGRAYKNMNYYNISIGRIVLVGITAFLFIILLSDDHIFEDTTLP